MEGVTENVNRMPDADETVVGTDPGTETEVSTTAESERHLKPIGIEKAASLTVVLGVALALLYVAREVFIPVAFAIVLSCLLWPLVRVLGDMRVPAPLGAALAIALLGVVVTLGILRLRGPVAEWLDRAPELMDRTKQRVEEVARRMRIYDLIAPRAELQAAAPPQPSETVLKVETLPTKALVMTKDFLFFGLETLVLVYLFLALGGTFMQKVVRVLPRLRDKRKAVEIVREAQQNISNYLATVAVINAVLGTVVGITLKLLGFPNPLLWGVFAGLLNFVPYLGPLIAMGVLLLVGFGTYDGWAEGLLPAAAYLLLHVLEADLITPIVLGQRLTLNPILVFGALMFWFWLWGIAGAVLAVPMLMISKVLCDHFRSLRPVAELLSR